MAAKKRKPSRSPDLTFEVDHFMEFTDKPKGGKKGTSPGVVTSYDPALAALGEPFLGKSAAKKKPRPDANGGGMDQIDRRRLKDIEIWLNNCLNLAQAVEGKPAAKIVQLLRDARSRVQQLRG